MKKRLFFIAILLFAASSLFAQGPGLPCGGGDPDDTTCPLDTWVIGFAGAAMLLTCAYLARKQKAATKAA